jgi:hypothetical protein
MLYTYPLFNSPWILVQKRWLSYHAIIKSEWIIFYLLEIMYNDSNEAHYEENKKKLKITYRNTLHVKIFANKNFFKNLLLRSSLRIICQRGTIRTSMRLHKYWIICWIVKNNCLLWIIVKYNTMPRYILINVLWVKLRR